jgi:hypothetical protein
MIRKEMFSKLQQTCFPEEFLFASIVCGSSIIVATGRHQERCDKHCPEPHVIHTSSAICNKECATVTVFITVRIENLNVFQLVFNFNIYAPYTILRKTTKSLLYPHKAIHKP